MYIMITKNDIDRITNNKFKIERLINNAVTACKRSQTNWSKDYWHGVFTKLCKKYNRNDLYNKHLHQRGYIMWKVFAIFCTTLAAGDCETKYEHPPMLYQTFQECYVRANEKTEETLAMMDLMNVKFVNLKIGCEFQDIKNT